MRGASQFEATLRDQSSRPSHRPRRSNLPPAVPPTQHPHPPSFAPTIPKNPNPVRIVKPVLNTDPEAAGPAMTTKAPPITNQRIGRARQTSQLRKNDHRITTLRQRLNNENSGQNKPWNPQMMIGNNGDGTGPGGQKSSFLVGPGSQRKKPQMSTRFTGLLPQKTMSIMMAAGGGSFKQKEKEPSEKEAPKKEASEKVPKIVKHATKRKISVMVKPPEIIPEAYHHKNKLFARVKIVTRENGDVAKLSRGDNETVQLVKVRRHFGETRF